MAEIADQMAGLPIENLICDPLIAVAKGQAKLCEVYLDQVFKLAWKDGNPENETNVIKFNLTRPVTTGTGQISKQSIEVEAPILSLVPVPAFTMQEATVSFTMEVKTSTSSKDETKASAEVEAEIGGGWYSAKMSGSVSTSSENTRSSDQSAKYEITAKAMQQPPAEGMAKLTQLFASVIEPVDIGHVGG